MMDKNGKVQVIPNSDDYRENFDKIDWGDRSLDRVRIYDPFLDGPIEELLPKPVSIRHEGGAGPIGAVIVPWPGSPTVSGDDVETSVTPLGTNTDHPADGIPHKE